MRQSPAVILLGAAIIVAFVAFGQFAPQGNPQFDRYAVVPALFSDNPGAWLSLEGITRGFGHVFFHYGLAHVAMNGLGYVQSAPFVARRVGDLRFLLIFFLSALGGAVAFVVINPESEIGAVGASGAICGLFGAYFLATRPTPRAALADPQVRGAIVSFLGVNVVLFALLPLPIAWEAHLGGFIAGALGYLALAPRPRRYIGPWG